MSDDILEHYGVKGMKWGVRRDRKRSGRSSGSSDSGGGKGLTKEQQESLGAAAAFEKQRAKELGAKYGPGSLSGRDFNVPNPKNLTPEQRQQIKDGLILGAKIGAAAYVGYVVYKGVGQVKAAQALNETITDDFSEFMLENNMTKMTPKTYADLTGTAVDLPAGTIVQRVSTKLETNIRDEGFYAAVSDADVTRYKAALPTYWSMWGIQKNPPSGQVMQIRSKVPIKAPSEKQALALFKEYTGRSSVRADVYANSSLNWVNKKDKEAQGFLQFVKDKGYNALIDTNDAGSLAEKPIRFLNGSDFEIAGNEPLGLNGIRAARETVKRIRQMLESWTLLKGVIDMPLNEEALVHYGVKGMKWGVRRSEAQLSKARAKQEAKGAKAAKKASDKAVRSNRSKSVSERRLIDQKDLDALVKRLESEKKLKNLVAEDQQASRAATKQILGGTGEQVARQVIGGLATVGVAAAVANKFGKAPATTGTKKVKLQPSQQDVFKAVKVGGKFKDK